MSTYLSVLLAILTYKLLVYVAPFIGDFMYRKLPKLKSRWNYNLNGDLCWWDHFGHRAGKIIGYRTLDFFGIKKK